MRKIGIIGGTFDPIHYGHLHLAKQALTECSLDQVIFMPVHIQPFKEDQSVTAGVHRFKMIELAIFGDNQMSVSDLELRSGEISYTVNTLRTVQKQFGKQTELSFIIGADAFLKIEKWKGASELLSDYAYIVGSRPGESQDKLRSCIDNLRAVYNTKITIISNKQILISATEIKERIKSGKKCSEFVPEAVERYIMTNGLYT